MENILELCNVSFAYDDSKNTLKNINAKFKKGEKVAVLGGNGAGKTTFFLVCNGILKVHHGEVLHFDEKIQYKKSQLTKLRKSVSIVFQEPENQIIASTVENEVSFGPMNMGLDLKEVAHRVDDSLEVLNLQHLKKRATHTLSGGEKKLVTIADILAMNPDIIFLDEPTSSLDPENTKILREILETLHEKGATIVISTHDIDFAYSFCDRAIIFSKGEIIADDNIKEVFEKDEIIKKSNIRCPILFEVEKLIKEGKEISNLRGLSNV